MITRRSARPLASFASRAWTCPSCTKASLLHQRLPPIQRQQPSRTQQREIHHVPRLPHDTTFREDGIPGLLSPTGYQIAWSSYQDHLITKLNALLADSPDADAKPLDLVRKYARDPLHASLFNHVSAAWNNHFFFSTMSTAPLPLEKVPELKEHLEMAFGSIETLQETMLNLADAMFGPGFVWLVYVDGTAGGGSAASPGVNRGSWRLLNTYLAGTPYPEAGYRQQGIDMSTSSPHSAADYYAGLPANTVGSFGRNSVSGKESAKYPPGGTKVMPVLCVNTWEHVYIYDFGLGGKRKYLADWWEAIDWSSVQSNMPEDLRKTVRKDVDNQRFR